MTALQMGHGRPFVNPVDGRPLYARPTVALRWLLLPYGRWDCADGRAVLFNRRYCPIYERRPGCAPASVQAYERVRFIRQSWFYDDSHTEAERKAAAIGALQAWGLPVPSTADLVRGIGR